MDLYVDSIDSLLHARSEIDKELRRHKSRVTIFFTDVVGSTTYFDRFGDTAGLLLLHRHDNLVTSAVEEFGGTVVKTIGDSVMAEFPEPVFAVRAAIQIQRRLFEQNKETSESDRLRIRAGINCGVGFRRGNDLFGEAVNVAARITKRSGPGQILVSQSVRDAITEPDITCASLGLVGLDGKAEPEELHEVVWTEPTIYQDVRGKIGGVSDRGLRPDSDRLDEFIQKTPAPGELSAGSSNTPLDLNFPPLEIPRYEILNRVGLGGMGIVFKARDRETGETVALKVLKPEIANRPAVIDAFKNELRLARKITHRNVCRIHDFNRTDGISFISMEFVEGESLRRVLDRFSALSVRTGIKIAGQIMDGLREAHAQGIVHRDLKPENLMIDGSGNVKLMDFGLAHLVDDRPTAAVGTPSYMAPEQAQGGPVDQRSDIYAFGLVLFEMFTGSAAFTGDTPIAVALKQIQETPESPRAIERTIPDYIETIILRCLEKDPAKRFQSITDVQAAMASHSVGPVRPIPALRKQAHWAVVGSACVVAAFILVSVVSLSRAPAQETQQAISSATDSELAAFHIAESLNTGDAWGAFLKDYPKGELSSVAHTRFQKLKTIAAASAPLTPAIVKSSVTPLPKAMPVAAEKPADAKPADAKPGPKLAAFVDSVLLSGGDFMMGNDSGKGDEKPRHQVKLDPFRITSSQITNRQYFAFLEDTGYGRPKDPGFAKNYLMAYPDLPVVNVSYADAVEFCAWASRKFAVSVRLPTEAEWEYAARGRSISSTKNMNGNVAEWTLDFYSKNYYDVSPVRNPNGPSAGTKRAVRGGSWADDASQMATSRRSSRDPKDRNDQLGFRIVVETGAASRP